MSVAEETLSNRLEAHAESDGCLTQVPPHNRNYFRIRGPIERLVALILLIPGLPAIGLLVLLVRLTSRGPGIYRQDRVGLQGRIYTMYKIRSMVADAEAGNGPTWSQKSDPRVTRIGRVLRKLHLDELPQLFNVLRGEMSLIGPRPERPEFVTLLSRQIDDYLGRIAVLPGVTGLAQINLPPDTDLNSVKNKLELDLVYINTASFWLDLRILACTTLRMVGVPGVAATRVTGIKRKVSGAHTAAAAGPESLAANRTVSLQEVKADLDSRRQSAAVLDTVELEGTVVDDCSFDDTKGGLDDFGEEVDCSASDLPFLDAGESSGEASTRSVKPR